MKILSLFDGISAARVALERVGLQVDKYYASEIDKYAIQVSQKNWSDIVQVGSVVDLDGQRFKNIDLLIGGFPCTNLSIAKNNREGLAGKESGLFYEMVRLHKEVKPKWFIYENVASMAKDQKQIITDILGVEPIMIDAALVSAQNRKRLFWTNITVEQPADRGIVLQDIIDQNAERKYRDIKNQMQTKNGVRWDTSGKGYFSQQNRAYKITGKFPTIPTARTNTKVNFLFADGRIGVMNWDEIEKLQSLPVGYTDLGNENRPEKRGGVIGNAFNVEVVAHIISPDNCG